MKKTLIVICLAIATGTLSSCRTVKGMGRDIQHLGNKIEQKADRVSPY